MKKKRYMIKASVKAFFYLILEKPLLRNQVERSKVSSSIVFLSISLLNGTTSVYLRLTIVQSPKACKQRKLDRPYAVQVGKIINMVDREGA